MKVVSCWVLDFCHLSYVFGLLLFVFALWLERVLVKHLDEVKCGVNGRFTVYPIGEKTPRACELLFSPMWAENPLDICQSEVEEEQ